MTERPFPESMPFLSARADHDEPSVFLPGNLLREARRQRGLPDGRVPEVCVLDPDGDFVRYLRQAHGAARSPTWACYHTELWETTVDGLHFGVVGCAVGAPFAVLVAEQLFASGCEQLISITSAGRVSVELPPSCLVLIDRALRGEGTSTAYLPPAPEICPPAESISNVANRLARAGIAVIRGTAWTTDAPFRETETALAHARSAGALVVEMEAAALYAFAIARNRAVVCFAHVTNSMAVTEVDFEKGASNGAEQALALVLAVGRRSSQG
jgi:uridine phosphorylase